MNAAVAFYNDREPSIRPGLPAPSQPGHGRRRRPFALLAVGVTVFIASLGGIAFATSGDDSQPTAPSAAPGASESDESDARPGRAGPGYVVD